MEYNYEGRTLFGASRAEERTAFLRSVYLWLMAGFAVAGLGALSAPFAIHYLVSIFGRYTFLPLLAAYYGTFFWANRVSSRKPWNRYAYASFTYVAGILSGLAMFMASATAGPGIVLAAFAMTAADFLALSALAFMTKKDFSFLRNFIAMGLGVAFVAILVGLFFPQVELLHLAISAVLVIACSAKLLWDTSRMLRTGDFSDAAGFALSLFLSLFIIFIHLLRLLSGGRRN